MKKYFILFLSLIFFNLILYFALEINKLFSYFVLSSLILYNYYFLQTLKKKSELNKDKANKDEFNVSADQHPVIKAAKERLRK